jgi:hypothetical protein
MKISRQFIPATHVASLVWCGDALVDWVGGGQVFHLDGKCESARVNWAYNFNAVRATPDGHFAVIFERCGTKALLLRDGKLLRELNRSYYQAEVYEYPICVWTASDGGTLLAHCPEDYNRIEIENAETGVRLTQGERKPKDFFHSRLMVNATGTRLLSAGWAWHPWSAVVYYEVAKALSDPRHLDGLDECAPSSLNVGLAEEGSACWQTTDRVLLGGSGEEARPDEKDAVIVEPKLHARGIAVYDVASGAYVKSVLLDDIPGTMMPVGETHAVCFYGHPRLVSLQTGEVVARWDDLDSGKQVSSILWNTQLPPLALDAEHQRFAVHGPGGITVVQIDSSE